MTTYTFNVVVEPDEDRRRAYCPALETQLVEEGKPVPAAVAVSEEPLVAVTV